MKPLPTIAMFSCRFRSGIWVEIWQDRITHRRNPRGGMPVGSTLRKLLHPYARNFWLGVVFVTIRSRMGL